MQKKNALDYILLALFIMCMALAFSASLEYSSVGTQRPFLLQGEWMLGLVVLCIATFIGIRAVNKLADRMKLKTKSIIAWTACGVLFFIGLFLRLYVIQNIYIEPESDYETYYRIAGELLNDTMQTAEGYLDRRYIALYPHTIGFPMLILLPAFRMFGQSVLVAQYANLVCSMISVLICADIGRKVAGRMGAVLAALMMSLWPSHILYANMVATEQSFTMFILMAADVMTSVLPREKGSLYDREPGSLIALLILTGILLAIAGAVRPMAMLLLAAFAVVQLLQRHDKDGDVALNGVRYALSKGWFCVLLVVLPYLATGGIITRAISDTILEQPASGLTASGYNLMVGVNVGAEGRWNEEDSNFFGMAYDSIGDANQAHAACMQVAFKRIASEPENVLNLLVYKFRDLWQTDDFGIDWNLQWSDQQGTLTPELKESLESIRPAGRLLYMALLLGSLVCALGMWRSGARKHPLAMVCVIFFLGTALSHMLLETQVRYHYNMLPFQMLLAVMGISSWRAKETSETAVKVVYREKEASAELEHEDNTHFDMRSALLEGNIIMTVTEAYLADAERGAADGGNAKSDETAAQVTAQSDEAAGRIAVDIQSTVPTEPPLADDSMARQSPANNPIPAMPEQIIRQIPYRSLRSRMDERSKIQNPCPHNDCGQSQIGGR